MSLSITLTINGTRRTVELDDPRVTLLDLLRERLYLTGTKKGCDRGQCGACTVLLDGRRINSCLALAVSHDGAEVLTIEGLARGDDLHPVQAGSWVPSSSAPIRREYSATSAARIAVRRRTGGMTCPAVDCLTNLLRNLHGTLAVS